MRFKYRKVPKHWKYQLLETYKLKISLCDNGYGSCNLGFVQLTRGGLLIAKKGYAWDGSTVVMDTKACMRASLVHDALYALMREGYLNIKWREYADQLYRDICIEDGMWRWQAEWRYWGLRWFAGYAAKGKKK